MILASKRHETDVSPLPDYRFGIESLLQSSSSWGVYRIDQR